MQQLAASYDQRTWRTNYVPTTTRRSPRTSAAGGDRDQILMLLGRLEEGLAGMREDMAEVKAEAQKERTDASESRRRIYEKLEEGEIKLNNIDSTVRVLGAVVDKQTNRIDALEPTVRATAKAVNKWNWRWGAAIAGLTAIGSGIWWLIRPNLAGIWAALQTLFP